MDRCHFWASCIEITCTCMWQNVPSSNLIRKMAINSYETDFFIHVAVCMGFNLPAASESDRALKSPGVGEVLLLLACSEEKT